MLNAASLYSPSALYLSENMEILKEISTLLDSGSTGCFIDSHLVIDNQLPLEDLKKPLWLILFDGSVASQGLIFQFTTLDIWFPYGTQHRVQLFLLTLLDQSVTVAQGNHSRTIVHAQKQAKRTENQNRSVKMSQDIHL